MVATARFTIRVFVTFTDCSDRKQRNRRAKGCEVSTRTARRQTVFNGGLYNFAGGLDILNI